jgi:hypothetical protein
MSRTAEQQHKQEVAYLRSELDTVEAQKWCLIHETRELRDLLQQARDTCCLDGERGEECLHSRTIP